MKSEKAKRILKRAYKKTEQNMNFYSAHVFTMGKKIFTEKEYNINGSKNRLDEIGLLYSELFGISFNDAMKELVK